MTSLRQDFKARVREVVACVRHITSLESGLESGLDSLEVRALKATVYLLLYNLIEATARDAVVAVLDKIQDEEVSFDDVRSELKVLVLTHLKGRRPDKSAEDLSSIRFDIFGVAFDADRLFSGNVDARKLRETARSIGVDEAFGADGETLVTIKRNRNDLAHGQKTFSEVGREVTMPDLRREAAATVLYMRAVLAAVERYIQSKGYLASPGP